MWLPDVNVLLSATMAQAVHHDRARTRIEAAFGSGVPVTMAWPALTGFIRLSTRRGIFERPLAVEEALRVMHTWLTHPASRIVQPGPRHAELLSALLTGAGMAGNLTSDAHLAAIAIEHGATLASFDKDFERFAGLRFEHLRA